MVNKDIFTSINEQAKENSARWKDIETYYKTLKQIVDDGKYSPSDMSVGLMSLKLLFLLVEQLRPMSTTDEQVEVIQNEIKDLILNITGEQK
jgi:hypothetical protein